MKRSVEEAFNALQQKVLNWYHGETSADVSVFVYPPEWEPVMLERFPAFAKECEAKGCLIELMDVGQGLLTEIQKRKGLEESLTNSEANDPGNLLHNLNVVAGRYLKRIMQSVPESSIVCRILVNTGALATFVSYSAIANDLAGGSAKAGSRLVPCVLAFPGEGNDKFLNLLKLRADTNYRTPRI